MSPEEVVNAIQRAIVELDKMTPPRPAYIYADDQVIEMLRKPPFGDSIAPRLVDCLLKKLNRT